MNNLKQKIKPTFYKAHRYIHNNHRMLNGILIFILVIMLASVLFVQLNDASDTKQYRENERERQDEQAQEAIEELTDVISKQTLLLCFTGGIEVDEITDEQRLEVRQFCEDEIERFEVNDDGSITEQE